MKPFRLLPLLIVLCGSSLVAQDYEDHQGQPFSQVQPAGANRPAGVPAGFVITPFGYFHPSCVLQLGNGESVSKDGLLHHADGSVVVIPQCQYPHFSAQGAPVSTPGDTHTSSSGPELVPTEQPAIGHAWIENSSVTTSTSYGKEVSTWTVPPLPLTHDGQTIYLFPGFEGAANPSTSILQPVVGYSSGSGWSMASWNCCLANTADESTPVTIHVGDTIVGTIEMTCAAGSLTCSTWNVISNDQTTNQSTELSATPSDGQTFNLAFGGVLEVYNVDQCLDYPANASLTFNSLLYDNNFNLIANPAWITGIAPNIQPQCDYAVTTTATNTTLTYGTTAPGFGLDITPAAGIAINQGGSASGSITITDINGFSGAVTVSYATPPTGITAQLTAGSAVNTDTLMLSATSGAAITGANQPATITLTASGASIPSQTFPVNVIVNPPLTGGAGTVVDLTSSYNAFAFFNDSVGYPMLDVPNSLDNAGDAYSANQLSPPGVAPMTLNLNNVKFGFGSPNQQNGVYGTGTNAISLPNASFNQLQLLGTGFGGAQNAQTITVTYTDNSTQTFTQTFDDWSTGPTCIIASLCTPGELVAVTMPYTNSEYVYSRNDSIYYLYEYSFALNPAKTLKSLTLPNNRKVVILAATLSSVTAAPTFSPAAGTLPSPQSVTISDATAGATIYYTTNGSVPTTSSNVYNGPITVSSSETVEAIAVGSGDLPSAITTAAYTVPPPNFAITGTAVTVTPGATTGNTSTITLTPSGGFTGAISLSCAITPSAASDPAVCSLPTSTTITGSAAQMVTLTVTTTPATSGMNRRGKFLWQPVGGIVVACLLFVGFPARSRRRWDVLGVLLLSFVVFGGALGCSGASNGTGGGSGGGGGTGSGGSGNPGTSPGTYSITVTGTSGTITQSATVTLTVQ